MRILHTYARECPLCHAVTFERCRFKNGKPRSLAHRERVDAAEEAAAIREAMPAPGKGAEGTVLLTPSLAADILRAEEVCHDEGIGPTGDEWKALVERARTTIAPGKKEGA